MTPSELVNSWHLGGWLTWHHPSGDTHETVIVLLYELESGEWLYVPPGYEEEWPVFGERRLPGPMTIKDGVIVFPEGAIEDAEKTGHACEGVLEHGNYLRMNNRTIEEEWQLFKEARGYPFK